MHLTKAEDFSWLRLVSIMALVEESGGRGIFGNPTRGEGSRCWKGGQAIQCFWFLSRRA